MWQLALAFVPVTLAFFAAQAAVLGGTRLAHPGEYPDPFAPYEAMMPGHFVMALENPPCDLQTTPGITLMIECELLSASSPFASVSSTAFDGRFVRIWFRTHDLYVGDIVRHWGRPDVVVNYNYRAFYIRWEDQGLVGFIFPVGQARQFNYMQPVEHFTIGLERRNLP